MKRRVALLLLLISLVLLAVPQFAFAAPEPTGVTLEAAPALFDLYEGKTTTLHATVSPAEASQRVTWTSSDRTVATVASNGRVTFRKPGTVTITATARGTSHSASVTLNLFDSSTPTAVTLTPPESTICDMRLSRTVKLAATVEPAAKAKQQLVWTSSDRSVATVSSRGVVTLRKRGTVTITATARGTQVASSVTLTVINTSLPDSITLDAPSTLTLDRFETRQLTPTVLPATANSRVAYKSSNTRVASVTGKGLITAKLGGTAVITCYSTADRTILATINLTVNQPAAPQSLKISPQTTVLTQGDTLQLTPDILPADACKMVTWRSSSTRTASITADGLLTARRAGYVTVTLTSRENTRVKDTLRILVVKQGAPLTITLPQAETLMHPTETLQLTPTVLPAERDQRVAYRSSRSGVAGVDANGLVTAKKPGTAVITCYSLADRNVQATFTVKVEYLPAPSSISVSSASTTVEKGETLQLTAKPVPADHSPEFTYKSSNTRIARVDKHGLVTGVKYGPVQIIVTSVRDRRVQAVYNLTVTDKKRPDAITSTVAALTLETGTVYKPTLTVIPSTAVQTVKWSSSNSGVVSVNSKTGELTMRRAGTATVTVKSTYDSTVQCAIKITVFDKPKPTALTATMSQEAIQLSETAQVKLTPTPADASTLATYKASSDVVTVSSTGVVTPNKLGRAVITVTSVKSPKVTATVEVFVYDPHVPAILTLSQQSGYLSVGKSASLTASIFPATASQKVTWSSSDPKIAAVSADGTVTGTGVGNVTIKATSQDESSVYATCTFAVSSDKITLVIPDRTTTISGIPANMAKIDAIRTSAISQIINLARAGVITPAESTARQKVINEAFKMQAFPWMTPQYQQYWTNAYLEKSYQPNVVYYGLPYIQRGRGNSSENRRYTVDRALSEGRYTDSGKGYYLLNQGKLLDKSYVGNDCSAFVSMAYWGLKHTASFYRTPQLAVTPYFKTLKSYDDLRTGDILVLSERHVIMFLYWANADRTQMMIIEQGGDGNTVICSVKGIQWYLDEKFIPRRLATYAQQ